MATCSSWHAAPLAGSDDCEGIGADCSQHASEADAGIAQSRSPSGASRSRPQQQHPPADSMPIAQARSNARAGTVARTITRQSISDIVRRIVMEHTQERTVKVAAPELGEDDGCQASSPLPLSVFGEGGRGGEVARGTPAARQ